MRAERGIRGDLEALVRHQGQRVWRRRYPGAEYVDPVQVVELPLSDHVAAAVVDAFDGSIFGPIEGGAVQDLYVRTRESVRSGVLVTTSSECFASVDVDRDWWRAAARTRPSLDDVVVSDSGFRFVDDHRVMDLWGDLEVIGDPREAATVLGRALARAQDEPFDALAAVTLVAEAVSPSVAGNLGWRLAGWPDPPSMATLGPECVNVARGVLDLFLKDAAWQAVADIDGVAGDARAEAEALQRSMEPL